MVSLIILSSVTHASLITNGSFEQLDPSSYGKVYNTNLNNYENKDIVWDVFIALPGWRTTYGNGINVCWYDTAIDFDFNMQAAFTADSTKSLTIDWTLQSINLIPTTTALFHQNFECSIT